VTALHFIMGEFSFFDTWLQRSLYLMFDKLCAYIKELGILTVGRLSTRLDRKEQILPMWRFAGHKQQLRKLQDLSLYH